MTIVELFDEEKLDNAIGTLLLQPERTVFLCSGKNDDGFCTSLGKVLKRRGIKTQLFTEYVDVSDKNAITRKLEELIRKYPDCDFDIAGGDDMVLVAMGEVAKKHNIPLHIASASKMTVTAINSDRRYHPCPLKLKVEDIVALYGGKTDCDEQCRETYSFERDLKAEEQIEKVWKICKSDPGAYNSAIGAMKSFKGEKRHLVQMIWSKLKKESLVYTEGNVVKYRSNLVKFLLQKQGTALEMYTYITAKETGFFDDGQCSVVIDWKGRREVENEIDVLLLKGVTLYFISCKNGMVDSDELYKLSIVADRFGGKNAKKILAITYFEPDRSFMERADELGIRVVKNVRRLAKKDFGKKLIN